MPAVGLESALMSRLPFDPSRLAAQDAGPPARRERARRGDAEADAGAISVTQLTLLIKQTLADHTPTPIKVVGEVSNFNERGHWFLSLKDEENVINGVMWSSAARKCSFRPERGSQVVATGRLDYYGPQGRLQLYIDKLEPVGQGALELRFRQLCEELRQAGWFDESRKRPLPLFPEKIAVITSRAGAALQDVIRTAHHRWPGGQLYLINVRTQGDGAAEDIARAIRRLSEQHAALGIEAAILTRGGGSIEDLWAFNERIVAEAIVASAVPIVAATGHEVDTTIAELVADLRCSTPTQAAERVVPDRAAYVQQLQQYGSRLAHGLRRRVERDRSRLAAAERHELFRRPADRLQRLRHELRGHRQRLQAALQHRLHEARHRIADDLAALSRLEPRGRLRLAAQQLAGLQRDLDRAFRTRRQTAARQLDALERQLQAVGPHNVLQRGYSYTTDAAGSLIRSTAEARPGERIVTHVADGRFGSTVDGEPAEPPPADVEATDLAGTDHEPKSSARPANPGKSPARRARSGAKGPQMGLFPTDG